MSTGTTGFLKGFKQNKKTVSHLTTHPWRQENNVLLLNICIFTQAAFENTYKMYAVDKNSRTSSTWVNTYWIFIDSKPFYKLKQVKENEYLQIHVFFKLEQSNHLTVQDGTWHIVKTANLPFIVRADPVWGCYFPG